MTNSRKEISFSGHTHSNYALTSHTHTGYAASNHTHSQYVTEVDINQMIEDVIDSYVPTITKLGQAGYAGTISAIHKVTFNVLASTSLVIISIIADNEYAKMAMLVKTNNTWPTYIDRFSSIQIKVIGSGNVITVSMYSGPDSDVYYAYF